MLANPLSGNAAKPPVAPRAAPGYANPGDPSVAAALSASVAANPQASGGGYEGATPQVDPVAGFDPYSVGGDPILAKIQAGNVKARQDAEASALAARKALAIQFGDASGFTDDANTADAAAHNPFSTLANLLRGYNQSSQDHGEALNQANLWYSGTHAKTLADDATAFQGQQYDARQAALGQLTGINSGLAGALSQSRTDDNNALGDAYGRATSRATTYGVDPGAIPQTAVTNTKPAVPIKNGLPVYGNPAQTATGAVKQTGLVKALGKQPPNAYLTNPNKKG